MKLDSPTNMGQAVGTCCRQSPVRGLVGSLVFCAILIGSAVLLWQQGFPWFAWGGGAVLAALLVPWLLYDALAKFRSTNWLLRLGPDGLWINLRSYKNRHLPEAATVLHLPYEEIASARRHIDTWTTPAHPSATTPTHWKLESLELSLAGFATKKGTGPLGAAENRGESVVPKGPVPFVVAKPSGATTEIAKALLNERDRRGGVKGKHQAVTVPTVGVVRIAWRGHGNDVVPRLSRVLDELSRSVKVEEPTRTDRPHWLKLSDAELDELVAQLVRSGDDLEAGQLLIRRRGCSATEAHKLVEEQGRRI
jgi:hypothetical protein